MGKNQIHCGEAGAGGRTFYKLYYLRFRRYCNYNLISESVKLCNNLALAVQMIGTSEALALVMPLLQTQLV